MTDGDEKDVKPARIPLLRRRIIQTVQDSLSRSFQDPFWAQLEEMEEDARLPLLDIQDREDHYMLVAELPGIPKDNVDVSVLENNVEISGDNVLACELGVEDLAYICNERTQTKFYRKVAIPGPILPEEAEASMEHGVLTVKLPKKLPEPSQKVSLKVE
jgi:HSP20 family protein